MSIRVDVGGFAWGVARRYPGSMDVSRHPGQAMPLPGFRDMPWAICCRALQLSLLLLVTGCSAPPGEASAALPPDELAAEPGLAPENVKGPSTQAALALVPFGDVDQEAIATVTEAIVRVYGWKVEVTEPRELPKQAWYAPRKRYRAEKLLDYLNDHMPGGADKIMGLTRKDISTTKGDIFDWGICGLAESPGTASVVSTYRIKKKLGKGTKAQKKERYVKRLVDLATHEFGHTLGLPHCPNEGCVMEDAKGTVLTFDHSTGKLCEDCARLLEELGFPLPPI